MNRTAEHNVSTPKGAIARQGRRWNRRAPSWDHGAENNPGLVKVMERVVAEGACRPETRAVDLGCGSGQLTLRIAPLVTSVLAIDVSEAMIDLLGRNATEAGVTNVTARTEPIESLRLEDASVDLVVSNYALHHLKDDDKRALVERCSRWLRPGGRLVVGDMMFGRGADQRDRTIIASKVSLMLRKGPSGWYRIAKNAGRFAFRLQERPVSMATWIRLFGDAGFEGVVAVPVVNEAAVVRGERR